MEKLKCSPMNYDWGKVGSESVVFDLLVKSGAKDLPQSECYGELWMGDHPKAPSTTSEGKRVSEFLEEDIPFLFKVLSIKKPLSLQSHPSKEEAVTLHEKDPDHYPDSNHKPELGYFLKESYIMYGFRPIEEIERFVSSIPELLEMFGDDYFKAHSLKDMMSYLLHLKEKSGPIESFKSNFPSYSGIIDEVTYKGIEMIMKYHPNDIGVFYPFILNTLRCQPGQALYIPANTLHAYLSGDLFEAMALSDNVIRAGMTSKFVDIEQILKSMSFEEQKPHWLDVVSDGDVSRITPPCSEFSLIDLKVNSGETKLFHKLDSPSVFLVFDGECTINGQHCHSGEVYALKSGTDITVNTDSDTRIIFCTNQ